MRIRNVLQECEALLEPVPGSPYQTARGKAEWKTYGNGPRQCKVKLSGLNLPDSSTLELLVEGRRLVQVPVQNGRARSRQETERGAAVPLIERNQVLHVLYAGQVILAGQFYEE